MNDVAQLNAQLQFIRALLRSYIEHQLPMSPGGASRALNEMNAIMIERREKPVSATIRPA